jgi:hypothetical protein
VGHHRWKYQTNSNDQNKKSKNFNATAPFNKENLIYRNETRSTIRLGGLNNPPFTRLRRAGGMSQKKCLPHSAKGLPPKVVIGGCPKTVVLINFHLIIGIGSLSNSQ